MVKICTRCKKLKKLDCFHKDKSKKDGYCVVCKECVREYQKQYRQNNQEEIVLKKKKYYYENIDKHRIKRKNQYQNEREKAKEDWKNYRLKNKDLLFESNRRYRENNKDTIRIKKREYAKYKRNIDPKYKLKTNISRALSYALKNKKQGRSWHKFVEFTLEELMNHLESQFKPGMSWDNYGRWGWHVDHKRPIVSFNFTTSDDPEFKECWALSNLQPLWAEENIRKGAKIIS